MEVSCLREGGNMEIMFSMKIKEDGKAVRLLLLCTECRGELEVAAGAGKLRFRCRKHGELGTLSAEEFADGMRQAQERATEQYGLGKPLRMKVVPAEPTIQ
jgi:hypothetical protein